MVPFLWTNGGGQELPEWQRGKSFDAKVPEPLCISGKDAHASATGHAAKKEVNRLSRRAHKVRGALYYMSVSSACSKIPRSPAQSVLHETVLLQVFARDALLGEGFWNRR